MTKEGLELSIKHGKLRDNHRCTACEGRMRIFMLKKDVWTAIAPKSCYLCWECTNELALRVLGRRLGEGDLNMTRRCNESFLEWLRG